MPRKQTFRTGRMLITLSIILILAATLFPYDFSLSGGGKPNDSSGFILHVLLFMPFGFALACLAKAKEFGHLKQLAFILLSGLCLSLITESMQFFLPRSVALSDALANIFGTITGFLGFHYWGFRLLEHLSALFEKVKRFLTIKMLAVIFAGYALSMFFVTISLQESTSLGNWDDTFSLLLGNERTANRPWQGYVYQLQIASRAISGELVAQAFSEKDLSFLGDGMLVCSYQFMDGERYFDQAGHLPELVRKGEPVNGRVDNSAFLGGGHWLETAVPATFLSQELRRTSQFTLFATVAAADTGQTGPARIVSLSEDPDHRNFTLGQEGNHLIFRLRTPLTGKNGANPELTVPNVFIDTNPHQLIVTYVGSELLVYVDGERLQQSLKLLPEAALFSRFFSLDARHISGYRVLYFGLIFVPLGILLIMIVKILKQRFVFN